MWHNNLLTVLLYIVLCFAIIFYVFINNCTYILNLIVILFILLVCSVPYKITEKLVTYLTFTFNCLLKIPSNQ